MREPNKRPRRNPLTSEEVSNIIAHNRKRELVKLYKLKKSKLYKLLNVFNITCIFLYLEILFCYFGPCHYQKHYSEKTLVHYGAGISVNKKGYFISDIDVFDVQGKVYKFIVEDCIDAPGNTIEFIIGKDFSSSKKNLKVFLENIR